MPASAFRSLRRKLEEGEIDPVYYLTGDEELLIDEIARAISDAALDPSSRDFNFDVRAAADLDAESLTSLIETAPMLADRRVVIVKRLEQWRKNAKIWQVLRAYVRKPSPTTVLILVHGVEEKPDKTIARLATHLEAKTPKPDEVRRWLVERARTLGFELMQDAADHLVSAVGTDLSQLAMELEKIAAAMPPDRPVALSDVAGFIGVRHGETIHDWVDAVLSRQIPRAELLLDVVLPQSGITGVRMVMTLGTALTGTRMARGLVDQGTGPGRLDRAVFERIMTLRPAGLRNWRAEAAIWAQSAMIWTASELDAAICAALNADRALKSTTLSGERSILRMMLVEIASLKAAA